MIEARTADEVIAQLKLKPHPEGGYFRETFRDEAGHQGRAHSTAILFLLKAGGVGSDAPSLSAFCSAGFSVCQPLCIFRFVPSLIFEFD